MHDAFHAGSMTAQFLLQGPSMAHLKLTIFGMTDVGRVRQNNEDAFIVDDLTTSERLCGMAEGVTRDVGARGILLAVSDGMGGPESGEVASSLALRSVRLGMDAGSADGAGAALKTSVEGANKNVWDFAHASGKEGMGATLTAMLVYEGYAYIAEIGDSRAYLLRGTQLAQLTRDQSYVQLLVDQGVLTPGQADESEDKNVILQAIGIRPKVAVAMSGVQLEQHDRVLLCSDGLSNQLSDGAMHAILAEATVDVACRALVDAANARGGEDNITAVVLDVAIEADASNRAAVPDHALSQNVSD